MSNHEYFQELSALSAIGQISSQEDRELAEHLRECAICSDVHLDFARVVQQQLPQVDPIRWRIKSAIPSISLDSEVRARFLARARVDGIDISPEVERFRGTKSIPFWRASQTWFAVATAAVAVLVISVTWVNKKNEAGLHTITSALDTRSAQIASENDALRAQLAALRQTIDTDTSEIEVMKQGKTDSVASQQRLQQQLDDAWQQVERLSTALHQTQAEKDELAKTSQADSQAAADLRARNDSLYQERAEMLSSRVLLEAQVRSLTASLQEKTGDLERERELMAMSKDVRQLMGARNLYIMDVHDVGGGGQDAKAFGRVFYAEGQSMIFYAFDLPSGKLSPAKYSFQGWGQRGTKSDSARNLGTFEVDDHEQRRWVLKVNNPALLAGIDSIFVTAESLDGAKTPRGKKLLYAYIVGQPNHP